MKPPRHLHTVTARDSKIQALSERATIDPVKFAKAQQRDNGATRAYTGVQIKAYNGKCWYVDINSGNEIANDTPVQLRTCDGSLPQQWDIITSGRHIQESGYALVVNAYTLACLSYAPGAPVPVHLFSCGGREDGEGTVDPHQHMMYGGGAGPLRFATKTNPNNCLQPEGDWVRQATCSRLLSDKTQTFTFSKFSAGEEGGGGGDGSSTTTGGNGSGTTSRPGPVESDTSATRVSTSPGSSPTNESDLRTLTLSSNGTSITVTVDKNSPLNSLENSNIFNSVPMSGTTGGVAPTESSDANIAGASSPRGLAPGAIAGIAVGTLLVILVASLCVLRRRRQRRNTGHTQSSSVGESSSLQHLATSPTETDNTTFPSPLQTSQSGPRFLSILSPVRPGAQAPDPTPAGMITSPTSPSSEDGNPNPFHSPSTTLSGHDTTSTESRQRDLERHIEMVQQEIARLRSEAVHQREDFHRLHNGNATGSVGSRGTDTMDDLRARVKEINEEMSRLLIPDPPTASSSSAPPPPPASPPPPMSPVNSDFGLSLDEPDTRSSWRNHPPPEYSRGDAASLGGSTPLPHYS